MAQVSRLSEQAAANEKVLAEHHRDRSEALDLRDRATERCIHLEAKVTSLEAERDSFSGKTLEAAKTESDEVARLTEENGGLRAKLEESVRAAATLQSDLADLRKRQFQEALKVTDKDAALGTLRTQLERATADLQQARAERAKGTDEVAKAKDEATKAKADAAKASDETARAKREADKARDDEGAKGRDEANKAKEVAAASSAELAAARNEAVEARAAVASAESATGVARDEAVKAGVDVAKLRQELVGAKAEIERERATARDQIDMLERAFGGARASMARTEASLKAAQANEEKTTRKLEAAVARADDAEARATAGSAALATLEQNVRRLREDIASGFAKLSQAAAPPPLPAAARARSVTAPRSLPPESLSSAPPSSRSAGPTMGVIPPNRAPAIEPGREPSVPPPTYASVPPQVHASAAPQQVHASAALPQVRASAAPQQVHASAAPQQVRASAAPQQPTLSAAPEQPSLSAAPPVTTDVGDVSREELLAMLVDPDLEAEAALELTLHPEWLRGVPPRSLIAVLQGVGHDVDRPVFDLARQWDREPLCHALIASLRSEKDAGRREHAAWLLKHLAAPSSWMALTTLARANAESVQLRRWLLHALERLAAERAIGWPQLREVVTELAKHPEASLREAVIGILAQLDRSDDKRRLLVAILEADEEEIVLATGVNALAGALPMELDSRLVERLLGHSSPTVQRSVHELIGRAKDTKS